MRIGAPILFATATIVLLEAAGADKATARRDVFNRHRSWPGVCSVFSRHPCAPTVCSVFHRGPCIPEIEYPIGGQDLRLTIVSTESSAVGGDIAPDNASNEDGAGMGHTLNTIRDLFKALRACWIPPPEHEARSGMQMTVRFSFKVNGQIIGTPRVTYKTPEASPETISIYQNAITAALDRCTPLPFARGLAGALAGRPIAIRFVDDRKPD